MWAAMMSKCTAVHRHQLIMLQAPLKAGTTTATNLSRPRAVHTSCTNLDYWEPHRKGGYGGKKFQELAIGERIALIKHSWKQLRGEWQLFKQEMLELYLMDPRHVKPGDSEYVFRFNSPESLANWKAVSDRDHSEGSSECEFQLNKYKKAVFKGVLNNQVPKDGKIYRSGYCNISSHRIRKSFKRNAFYDWYPYTHLVMRVRGDGRSYMINLLSEGSFDLTWNDNFTYVLYTRGGPYWQMVKIPFSKFFLSSKGRIQDKQVEITLNKLTNIGITCAGKVPGPFQLEIDYIAVLNDPTHTETFAYEMYDVPNYMVKQ